MKKILIVDDEEWIRLGLREQVNWNQLGLEIIGDARNGLEAINIIDKNIPHIIITDIRMPLMDGIELIRYIYNNNLKIKIIVISGYSEFEYAQKAISYNVSDYILKPIEELELEKALLKIISEINKDEIEENKITTHKKEKILTNFILGSNKNFSLIENILQFPCAIPSSNYLVSIVLKIFNKDNIIIDLAENSNIIIDLFSSALEKITYINYVIFRNYTVPNEYVVLINITKKEKIIDTVNKIDFLINSIIEQIQDSKKYTLFVGIGNLCAEISNLPNSYTQALQAVINSGLVGNKNIVNINEVTKRDKDYSLSHDTIVNLLYYIENGYKHEALKKIEFIFKEIKIDDNISPGSIRNMILNLIVNFNKLLHKYNSSVKKLLNVNNLTSIIDTRRFTIDGLKTWLTNTIHLVLEHIGNSKKIGAKEIIKKAVEYIKNNFSEDISLQSLSDRYFIDTAYLSRIFKSETDINFNVYLNKIRMESASELLKNKDLRMSDVAKMTGYSSTNYFLRKFKTYFGCTPTEYRKNLNPF